VGMHLDFIIAGFINLRSFWVKPFVYFLNSMLALAVITFYILFIFYVYG
jgi:hypothetical protein